MNAVDTNILIYVNDPRDPVKQEVATSLISDLTDDVLLWQVACEYLAASANWNHWAMTECKLISTFVTYNWFGILRSQHGA